MYVNWYFVWVQNKSLWGNTKYFDIFTINFLINIKYYYFDLNKKDIVKIGDI